MKLQTDGEGRDKIGANKAMIEITRAELAIVLETADRLARREGKRFVLDWSRIKLVDQLDGEPLHYSTRKGAIAAARQFQGANPV